MPKRGRGGRRERYRRGRRFCGEASFAARRMPRTVSRLKAQALFSAKFSVKWESLKPRYLPGPRWDQLLLGRQSRPRHGAPAVPCRTQSVESG